MSSESIRAIAQTFLTAPPIAGLPLVMLGWDSQMELISTGNAIPSSTLAALHVIDERERRLTVPAVLGWTVVDYDLQLQVCMLLEGTGDEMATATDRVVELIKQRLRSDPLMGSTPAHVFEAAQNAGGGNIEGVKIRARRGDVLWLNFGAASGTPIQWVSVEWTATEHIKA